MTGVSPRIPKPEQDEGEDSAVVTVFGYVVYLIVEFKWVIALGIAVALALGVQTMVDIPTWGELPRWSRLLMVGGGGAIVIAWIPAKHVYDAYFEIPFIRVNEVDALRDVNRSYDITPDVWETREMVEGEMYLNSDGEYVVQRVEWTGDKLKLWGIWKGEATDTELETWEYALEETQGRQRFWMSVGKTLKAKMPYYLRSLEQSITERVARQTMNKSTDSLELYEDEVVESAEILVDSVDVPEDYYSEEFEQEVEAELSEMLNEDTGGAWEEVSSGDDDE